MTTEAQTANASMANASMDDASSGGDLRGALEAAVSAQESSAQDASTAAPVEASSDQTANQPEGGGDGEDARAPARDADGRFAAASDAGGSPSPQAPSQAPPAFAAPDYLPDADKAALAALPDEARAVALRALERQHEAFAAHTADVAVERRFYADMQAPMQAVSQYAERFKAHPKDIVEAWAMVQQQLLTDPVAALQGLATQFNVDLATLAANPPSPQDAALSATQREVQELRAFMDQQRRREQAQRQNRERAVMAETAQTIEAFGAEKAADGQPLRPHFQTLRADMAALIAAGQARDLADAYDKAVWANPSTRADMQRREAAKQQAEEQKRRAEQAAKAKAAGGSVFGSPGASVPLPSAPAGSVGAALQNAIMAQAARV